GCYEIPPNLTYEEAALMDVLAVCTHAFKRANHHLDMTILIMGAGPIGNGIAQVARNSGVAEDKIVIMENNEVALRMAEDTGFQNIIDSTDMNVGDLYDNILKISRGKIYSIFDSIGTNFSFNLGLKLLEKGGTFINLAVHDQKVENLNQMQFSSERKITTSSNFSRSAYEQAWKWLQRGGFTLEPWLTRISLEDVPKIFEEIFKNKGDKTYFKLVVLSNSI
ncbi:MAG: zinc-binding dehydrogenase, partial [Promethearchaeota archaeon]